MSIQEPRPRTVNPVVQNNPERLKLPLTAVVVVPQFHPNLLALKQTNTSTKGRRTNKDKNPENKLAVDFLSSANEDILLEILLRLPNSRSAIQSSTVCRGWLELISQPQFIPRFIRMRRDHCYTILFRRHYNYLSEKREYYQDVCKLFSNESLLLHGTSSSSNYFDFMPELTIIAASCNDLLLMSPDPRGFLPRRPCPKFYICNPVTKKWSVIPGDYPHGSLNGFALICDQDHQYKVVLIYYAKKPATPHVPAAEFYYRTRVMVFCTKSAQWSELNFSFPMRPTRDYSFSYRVVACNGVLYWMDGYLYLDRIVALDLFNNQRGVVIYLPEVIHNNVLDADNDDNVKVHLGAVGGDKLRLLHMFRAGRDDRKCFVVKVWELNGNSWVLVHEKDLKVPNGDENNMVSVAFHPKDCDVVFVICGMSVFEYRFSENACYKLGEIQEAIGDEGLDSFLLEHTGWPTVVPSFYKG